jgi:hypothetical protein
VVVCIGDDFQQVLDAPAPDRGDDPELGKIGADRVDDGRLLADEEMARTGFEASVFYGMAAPKGTPPEIVDLLNKAVNEALKDPRLLARLSEMGGIPKQMTPAEFGKYMTEETEKWRKVVEFSGASVD